MIKGKQDLGLFLGVSILTIQLADHYILSYCIPHHSSYTLPKFRRYNKASLGELVLLEILNKHQQGYLGGVWPCYTSFKHIACCTLNKGRQIPLPILHSKQNSGRSWSNGYSGSWLSILQSHSHYRILRMSYTEYISTLFACHESHVLDSLELLYTTNISY